MFHTSSLESTTAAPYSANFFAAAIPIPPAAPLLKQLYETAIAAGTEIHTKKEGPDGKLACEI